MKMLTKDVQPARLVLMKRRIQLRHAADAIGIHPFYLGRCLSGIHSPSPAVRRALAEFLDLPESECFTDEPENDDPSAA